MSDINLRQSWNRLSGSYQREFAIGTDAAHYGVAAPDEDRLRLLGEVSGRRILELGCGGGQCSVAFARQGAQCVAVDLSDAQIDYARALAAREGVEVAFHQGDLAEFLESQPDAAYDLVFSAYAFPYVEDLAQVFKGARRVLRPGGYFVFSLDHPFNNVVDQEEDRLWVAQSYFSRGRMDWPWSTGDESIPFYSFHRTVGDFLNLLVDAGFVVERLLEPEPPADPGPWDGSDTRARYAAIPATIIWKARAQ